MKQISFLMLFCLLLTGCLMYRPAIQQGNVITPEQVTQLKVGMTTDQVRYVMGTPVLENTFSPHRWDYVYTLKAHNKGYVEKHITIFFTNGIVQRIQA